MANTLAETDILVLTKEGVTTMTKGILETTNNRIAQRIVDTISEGDVNHVPSSDTVYKALSEINIDAIVQLVIEDGDITKAEITPNNHTLYMVRTSALAKFATPYIWVDKETGFISGSPEAVRYLPLETDDINECIAAAVEATNPEI